MTIQIFQDLLRRTPFEPFRVTMTNGESDEVPHPDLVKVMMRDLLVGIDPDEDRVPDRFKVCAFSHIASVGPVRDYMQY